MILKKLLDTDPCDDHLDQSLIRPPEVLEYST